MEDIDGGLHPAVDGQSLDDDDIYKYMQVLVWNPQYAQFCMYANIKMCNSESSKKAHLI